MKRTVRRLSDYWQFGVTSRTQPFAWGDVLPRAGGQINPTVAPSSDAALVTGNPLLPAYTSETMFDVKQCSAMERNHTKTFRGVDAYKVVPLSSGDAQRALTILNSISTAQWEELLWEALFKDFPNFRKPFRDAQLRQEFVSFFIDLVKVADDEAAVAAIAEPYVLKQLQSNYITPPTWWRISEALCNGVDAFSSERHRYEKRVVREVIERVTKISLNTLAKQPWTSPDDAVNPILMNIGAHRGWHDAGNW